ncbi:MAG TPA: hypothetical protein VJ499_17395 [Flavisolibacter sp.]|nr:hypothetical protein [Flavisolibacter sp.]
MNQKTKIIDAVKSGMKQACHDMYSFTDQPELTFNAEYLFTVATAKAIDTHNFLPAHEFEIRIEHSTRKFARDCLPAIKRGHPMAKGSALLRVKASPKIGRPGRIDIAIYRNLSSFPYGREPLCAIEVKGFNPQRALVLEDLRRNLQFMRVSGPTGGSVLEFTTFAALHSVSAPKDTNSVTALENTIKEKYKAWMAGLGSRDDMIEEIDTFTISWELDGTISEENDELVIDTSSRHHFIGAIVTFSRPSTMAN